MASYTPNLNLIKPADADSYDVANDNGNMDKIDAAYASLNSNLLSAYDIVPLASGITGTIYIMRMGKLRVLTGYIDPHTSGASVTIATLATSDRPPLNIQGSYSGYGVTATGEFTLRSSNGVLELAINGTPSNTIKFNITYAIA